MARRPEEPTTGPTPAWFTVIRPCLPFQRQRTEQREVGPTRSGGAGLAGALKPNTEQEQRQSPKATEWLRLSAKQPSLRGGTERGTETSRCCIPRVESWMIHTHSRKCSGGAAAFQPAYAGRTVNNVIEDLRECVSEGAGAGKKEGLCRLQPFLLPSVPLSVPPHKEGCFAERRSHSVACGDCLCALRVQAKRCPNAANDTGGLDLSECVDAHAAPCGVAGREGMAGSPLVNGIVKQASAPPVSAPFTLTRAHVPTELIPVPGTSVPLRLGPQGHPPARTQPHPVKPPRPTRRPPQSPVASRHANPRRR